MLNLIVIAAMLATSSNSYTYTAAEPIGVVQAPPCITCTDTSDSSFEVVISGKDACEVSITSKACFKVNELETDDGSKKYEVTNISNNGDVLVFEITVVSQNKTIRQLHLMS